MDCQDRITSALAASTLINKLAVKSGNNKIIYQNILIALAYATDDLPITGK